MEPDGDGHHALVDKVLNPSSDNADDILASLGLAGLPTRHQVHAQIEQKLLLPKSELPDHWLPTYQLHWQNKLSIPSLLKSEPSPPPTSLAFVRTGLQGRVTGYTEVCMINLPQLGLVEDNGFQKVSNRRVSTGLTSTALDRAPGPSRNFVRGKSGYVPFWPGGLENLKPSNETIESQEGSAQLRIIAPGLSRGLRLPGSASDDTDPDVVNLSVGRARVATGEDETANGHPYEFTEDDVDGSFTKDGATDIDELLPTSKRDWAHEVDINKPMTNFHELVPEMAHEYPFKLDTFQKEAVYHLEMGDSVFVAAHTSAGKTVVAEYAIALAAKHMTRAIYTSPIKALSNQKYRDFKQTYGAASVGILTGDVQINPEANCLIMTTEILRSMLYKGADLIRDVEFVIFDEVHYVNDAERGVVWEEVIIMLPDHVNIILLSATVPNTKEFADWVGRTKKKDIYVISTAKRPVPLEHYLYAGRDLHKIVDEDRNFLTLGYKSAGEALRRKQDKEREKAGLPPVQRLEKSEIHVAIEKALSRLKGSDKQLPQIRRMRDLLSRGIGVHHGGLLPIVKEVVEILFARGLVKVLFATETFAMGVNMPAKCVVFSHIRKHDGRSFRDILPGEYTQMAGRAGRRGLDATGTVIIVANDECPEQTTLQTMILGTPNKLQSQFRLTYNMILNLLRVEALRVEEMIKRSFSENASQRLLPENQKKVAETERKLYSMPQLDCDVCTLDIERFYDTSFEIVELNDELLVMATRAGGRHLTSGRVIILRDGHFKWNIGVFLKVAPAPVKGLENKEKLYYVLAVVSPDTKKRQGDVDPQALPPRWPPLPEWMLIDEPQYELTTVPLSSIVMAAYQSIKVDTSMIVDGLRISAMNAAVQSLQGVLNEWLQAGSIPEAAWGKTRRLEFQDLLRRRDELIRRLDKFACTSCPKFEEHYLFTHSKKLLAANIANLKRAISDENLELIPDYEQRIDVLKELKFIDDNSTVLLKGRVACEINSANELVLTELILENALANYDPEEVVALLSCFVFQEKTEVEPVIPPKLKEGLDAVMGIAERVGAVQDRHKVAAEEFRALKAGLVEVVYEWARGMPFEQITELTDVAEGTIVRCITRLDETCREVRDAARVIGDAELFKKMEEAQIKIKRDIVFAASLYF
ncbi:antiviral helicase [Fomes fomentarius]|nr:antiviral helicase [Fomes fomentarius]